MERAAGKSTLAKSLLKEASEGRKIEGKQAIAWHVCFDDEVRPPF